MTIHNNPLGLQTTLLFLVACAVWEGDASFGVNYSVPGEPFYLG